MQITESQISWASKVSKFMQQDCFELDPVLAGSIDELPYGDLAYGQALEDWHQKGCPKDAFFSYAATEKPCPFLMAFRHHIVKHFGLEILTSEEGAARQRAGKYLVKKVVDWGHNN